MPPHKVLDTHFHHNARAQSQGSDQCSQMHQQGQWHSDGPGKYISIICS